MNFAEGMKGVIRNLDTILKVQDTLTPEVLSLIESMSDVDIDKINESTEAVRTLDDNKELFNTILNGLEPINKIVSIQNQVQNVSDYRDVVSTVAGSMTVVHTIHDNIDSLDNLSLLVPKISEMVEMKPTIEEALMMKGEIELTAKIAESLRDEIVKAEELQIKASNSAMLAADMVNKASIIEKRIDEKLKKVEEIESKINNLSVNVEFVSSAAKSKSSYNKHESILSISIPAGRPGLKGDSVKGERGVQGKPGISGRATREGKQGVPGKNGLNFAIDVKGKKRELIRYGNRVKGTSFLSLDESPSMIYFKKSDTVNDWTDGQAFGVSDGSGNADTLNGYTLDQIYEHIEQAFKRTKNART